MSTSQTVDRNRSHRARARKLLWPPAVAVFLFTVAYPANDFYGAKHASDIGIGLFLVYAGVALPPRVSSSYLSCRGHFVGKEFRWVRPGYL
jgi:hypothetical protein